MRVVTARVRAGLVLASAAVLTAACSTTAVTSGDPGTSGSPAAAPHAGRPVPGLPAWRPRAPLHVSRDDFATAVVGRDIWALGGMSGDRGTRLRSIEVYDTRTDTWRTSRVTMPEGLASFEGTAIGHDIYVFGGLDGNSLPSDFAGVLDTTTGRWRRLPPLPVARYAHTVTLHDGLVYVIGGDGKRGAVAEVDIFDPKSERWSTGAPMPKARSSHDAVSVGGLIYVLGGWLGSGPTDLMQTYDPTTRRWAEAPRVPEPVSRAGVTALDGRIWVSRHTFSAVFDVDKGTWSRANPLTFSRHGLGFVPVGHSIYGIGGCSEEPEHDVRTVDVLRLS